MDQLIDITCVPIKLEFETQPLRVEYEKVSEVNLDIEVEKGSLDIKNNIPKIDSIEISRGPHITPICTAKKGLMNDIAKSLSTKDELLPRVKLDKVFSNKAGSELSKSDELAINHKPDKVEFNVENEMKRKIIPGNIEYSVSQYPDVIVDYIGGMIYVPPSSDPDYEENS